MHRCSVDYQMEMIDLLGVDHIEVLRRSDGSRAVEIYCVKFIKIGVTQSRGKSRVTFTAKFSSSDGRTIKYS